MREMTVAGLRCSEVLEQLSAYLDAELGPAEVERIEGHLLECPNCERFGSHFGKMVVSLRRPPDRPEPVDSKWVSRLLLQLDELGVEP